MEGPFNDPGIPDGERTAYRGLVGDEEAGTGEVTVEHGDERYRQVLVARVAGRADLRAETIFRRRSGTIHAETHEMQSFDGDSAPVSAEQACFRGVKVLHWGAEIEPFPRDMAPLLGCALALRGLEFERGAIRGFSVWLANSVYWPAEARVERRGEAELPGGRREAWRVRARPSFERVDAPRARLMDMLTPPLILHFDA